MPQPILVGHDPRHPEHAPVDFGVAAARLTGAPLIVISVHAGHPSPGQKTDAELVSDCTGIVAELQGDLAGADIDVDCRIMEGTNAARVLHEAAERENAGLLVIGSSRPSAPRAMLGTTADRLVHGAPCPIAVVPHGWRSRGGIETIGVGFVDTEEGREALRAAAALARREGATVRVITVVSVGPQRYAEIRPAIAGQAGKDIEDVEGEHKLEAERVARAAVAELAGDVAVEIEAVVDDDAATVLITASERLDLLVCGARGYGPLRAVLLGSVTHRVCAEARCPVLVLPRGVRAPLDALLPEGRRATTTA
jgi:nucleotide-binding universal stress UspA family protein